MSKVAASHLAELAEEQLWKAGAMESKVKDRHFPPLVPGQFRQVRRAYSKSRV
jgi:hypothetical protein